MLIYILNLYVPYQPVEKIKVWNEIWSLKSSSPTGEWYLVGEFNVIIDFEKWKGKDVQY